MRVFTCSIVLFSVISTLQAASLFNCRNPGNVCGSNGLCNKSGQCQCVSGYIGERCLVSIASLCSNVAGVANLDCNQNGLCTVLSGVPRCICNAGFSGDRCQDEPMACNCSNSAMTVRMDAPGTFTEGVGYVLNRRDVPGCVAQRMASSSELVITTPFLSSACGTVFRNDLVNGEYEYKRTFRYYYDNKLITNFGIDFTCRCIFGTNGGVIYARFEVDQNDFTNLIQQEGVNYLTPVSYVLSTAGGILVTRSTALLVGDALTLAVTADTGFCVIVERIVANNSLTGNDRREATLMENRCLTTDGKKVFDAETGYTVDMAQGVLNMGAFLFPVGNTINMAIYFTAYPSGLCSVPTCPATGRKRRQAGSGPESSGTFQQIIVINNPETIEEPTNSTTHGHECHMTTHVMVGLIAMAAVICILLVICFVVGLRMIATKRRSAVEPPAYKQ